MATPQAPLPPCDVPDQPCAHYYVRDASGRLRFCVKCGRRAPGQPVGGPGEDRRERVSDGRAADPHAATS